MYNSVADPDLQLSGGGGGEGRGARSQKKHFSALSALGWSKNKGGRPGPSPGSATVTFKCINGIAHEDFGISLQKDAFYLRHYFKSK